jgi:hypothetical protein
MGSELEEGQTLIIRLYNTVMTNEELLERKSSGFDLENRE